MYFIGQTDVMKGEKAAFSGRNGSGTQWHHTAVPGDSGNLKDKKIKDEPEGLCRNAGVFFLHIGAGNHRTVGREENYTKTAYPQGRYENRQASPILLAKNRNHFSVRRNQKHFFYPQKVG